jgi:hypothetical protein
MLSIGVVPKDHPHWPIQIYVKASVVASTTDSFFECPELVFEVLKDFTSQLLLPV